MSWARGTVRLKDGSTIEAGYAVRSTCEMEGCTERIDRGLAYRCGGADFDEGCGHYFCSGHLYYLLPPAEVSEQLCGTCSESDEYGIAADPSTQGHHGLSGAAMSESRRRYLIGFAVGTMFTPIIFAAVQLIKAWLS